MLRGDLMTASVRPILASAAIPTFFRSVRLDGGTYWDGLFSQNPPIKELTDEKPDEIWVIQINPSELEDEPRRGRDNWLRVIQSVTPLEEIPRWVISNYFYREMSPWLRYSVVPFLILFTASIVNLVGLALEASGIISHTHLPGRPSPRTLWHCGFHPGSDLHRQHRHNRHPSARIPTAPDLLPGRQEDTTRPSA